MNTFLMLNVVFQNPDLFFLLLVFYLELGESMLVVLVVFEGFLDLFDHVEVFGANLFQFLKKSLRKFQVIVNTILRAFCCRCCWSGLTATSRFYFGLHTFVSIEHRQHIVFNDLRGKLRSDLIKRH